jgi:hypothetical protein
MVLNLIVELNLVHYTHNWNKGMVEYWVHSCPIRLKNNTVHGINKSQIGEALSC